jgi:hypothetical protein
MQTQVMQADSTEACMTHLLLQEGWKKARREPGGKHAAPREQVHTQTQLKIPMTTSVTCYRRRITLQHKEVQGAGAVLPPAGLQQLLPLLQALLVPEDCC